MLSAQVSFFNHSGYGRADRGITPERMKKEKSGTEKAIVTYVNYVPDGMPGSSLPLYSGYVGRRGQSRDNFQGFPNSADVEMPLLYDCHKSFLSMELQSSKVCCFDSNEISL